MYKYLIVLALLAGSAHCQESSGEGAPEPYAYAYETDSHAASEQRDPSGTVTGFYTLADADGRQRRVEYVADKDGFRAKVQTNEVGTKSENSADVEVLASPPTAEQVYQTATVQAAPAPAPVSTVSTVSQVAPVTTVAQQQRYVTVQQQAPLRTVSNVQYVQQPGYGYNYGYNYYPGYAGYTGYTGQRYGYGAVQGVSNGVVGGVYNTATVPVGVASTTGSSQYGVNTYGVGNYNYHTPSSYYTRYSSSAVQPASYGVVGTSRYVTSNVVAAPSVSRTSSYSVVPSSVSYGAPVASVSSPASAGVGATNYILLKKRQTQK